MLFNFDISIISIISITVLTAVLFYFLYFLKDDISLRDKIVLFASRVLVLIIFFIVLLKPVLNKKIRYLKKKDFVVLFDVSKSMKIENSEKFSGIKFISEFIKSEKYEDLKKRFNLNSYAFTKKLELLKLNEKQGIENKIDDNFTSIGNAISDLKNRAILTNVEGILIVSDGNSNFGFEPFSLVNDLNIPIYTIGAGLKNRKKDILIESLDVEKVWIRSLINKIGFKISQTGFNKRKVEVVLKSEDKILKRKIISFSDQEIYKDSFDVSFDKIGNKKLKIEIPVLKDEFSKSNNSKNFFVKVIKDRVNVLMLANDINFDFKFLKSSILSSSNVNLDLYIHVNNEFLHHSNYNKKSDKQQFNIKRLSNKDFNLKLRDIMKYDLFVLFDPYRVQKFNSIIEHIKIATSNSKKGCFFAGINGLEKASNSVKAMLPVKFSEVELVEEKTDIRITNDALFSSIFSVFHNEEVARVIFNNLPSIDGFAHIKKLKPGATKYLTSIFPKERIVNKKYNSSILFSSHKYGNGKVLFLNATGFYKLPFYLKETSNKTLFENIISNSIFWLSTFNDDDIIDISINKQIISISEKFESKISVYDENYSKIKNATIKAYLIDGEKVVDRFNSSTNGNGDYFIEFINKYKGDLKIKYDIYILDKLYKTKFINIQVIDKIDEYKNYVINEKYLKKISDLTNGKYIRYDKNIKNFLSQIKDNKKEIHEKVQILIWHNHWFYFLIIILLVFEWFYRKKIGLD